MTRERQSFTIDSEGDAREVLAALLERAKAARNRLAVLTPRELSVLIEVTKGNSNKIAGQNLGISPRTIEVHRARIMDKLQANSLPELIRLVLVAEVDGSFG